MTVLVLDFDGTMTDAELEGRPFVDGYLEDVASLVGKTAADVMAIATEADAEIAAAPDDARAQAAGIVQELAAAGIEVEPDREIVALIAYLQSLGKKTDGAVAEVKP